MLGVRAMLNCTTAETALGLRAMSTCTHGGDPSLGLRAMLNGSAHGGETSAEQLHTVGSLRAMLNGSAHGGETPDEQIHTVGSYRVGQPRALVPTPRDALRAMTKRELRLEAQKLGVAVDVVDAFRDDEMPREEFIEHVAGKMQTARCGTYFVETRAARSWSGVCHP